jgi:tripartite-type tricarboxylate transporter receptor subunit TctC
MPNRMDRSATDATITGAVPRKRRAKRSSSLVWLAALAALLTLGPSTAASAQTYPARPIWLVVPFAPGGPNDVSARVVADELSKVLGQSVIADNRPGGGGNLAAEAVVGSEPDGHTLFWAQGATHGINPTLYRKLGYDAVRDFAPVGLIGSEPLVLVTKPQAAWSSIDDLVIAAKIDAGSIHFGSGGIGTTPHMAGELLAAQAGVRLVHVPYRGSAPALGDVVAGRIQLIFAGMNSALGHIRKGTLKALAVTSRERAPVLADVPAIAETLPDYDVVRWGGIAAPAGTPAHVIARLSQALQEIGARAAVKQRFGQLGVRLDVGTPQQMDAFVREQTARWRRVIEANAIGLD